MDDSEGIDVLTNHNSHHTMVLMDIQDDTALFWCYGCERSIAKKGYQPTASELAEMVEYKKGYRCWMCRRSEMELKALFPRMKPWGIEPPAVPICRVCYGYILRGAMDMLEHADHPLQLFEALNE
jgi:hypothetical protein